MHGNWRPNPAVPTASLCRIIGKRPGLQSNRWRLRYWWEGRQVTTKRHEPESPRPKKAVSAHADDWNRQFIKHLEIHLVDAGRNLPVDLGDVELRIAALRAVFETLTDSGMESESALELLGHAAIERKAADSSWRAALNQRRFALIDKEIQGTLTPVESVGFRGFDEDHARSC